MSTESSGTLLNWYPGKKHWTSMHCRMMRRRSRKRWGKEEEREKNQERRMKEVRK